MLGDSMTFGWGSKETGSLIMEYGPQFIMQTH